MPLIMSEIYKTFTARNGKIIYLKIRKGVVRVWKNVVWSVYAGWIAAHAIVTGNCARGAVNVRERFSCAGGPDMCDLCVYRSRKGTASLRRMQRGAVRDLDGDTGSQIYG